MAKTGHPNFDYTCEGLWRGVAHNFSITGNHSGTSFGATDAETFMTGAASPYALSFAPWQSSGIKVVGARYYDGQNSAPVYEVTYNTESPAPSTLEATEAAWTSEATGYYLPLEVCALLYAQVGFNSKSKPVYIRKYLRGIPPDALGEVAGASQWIGPTSAGTAALAAMSNGSWYNGRIYISPSAGQPMTGWSLDPYCSNHQVPRGKKRKVASTSNSVLDVAIQLAKDAAAAAATL